MGHCVTGSFYGKFAKYADKQQCENKATRWLVRHIVPKDELAQFLRETDDDYWGAAEEFGVEIKMIIDACYYHFRVEPAAIRARLGIEEE